MSSCVRALLTPVMIVVSFALTISSSLELSLIIASTVPIIVIGVVAVGKASAPISERQQGSLDRLNRIFRENLTGIRVIRSFNNDRHETERFDRENRFYMKQSRSLFKLMSSTEPVFFLVMNLAALAIYYVAAGMIDAEHPAGGQAGGLHGISVPRDAVRDAVLHGVHDVSARQRIGQAHPGRPGDGLQRHGTRIGIPASCSQTSRRSRFDHVTFVYPDGEEAVLKDCQLHGAQRRDDRVHRLHRFGQEHARLAGAALL